MVVSHVPVVDSMPLRSGTISGLAWEGDMAFWVVRAGKHGENEAHAVEQQIVLIGWDSVGNLGAVKDREALQQLVEKTYPDESLGTQRVWTGEGRP
jgi:hypothetical protein